MIFSFLAKMATLQKDKNENFKCNNFDRKCFDIGSLKRGRKPFFNILSGLPHKMFQYTTYGKAHWVTLNFILGVYFSELHYAEIYVMPNADKKSRPTKRIV